MNSGLNDEECDATKLTGVTGAGNINKLFVDE
jgi:hypothetical protein